MCMAALIQLSNPLQAADHHAHTTHYCKSVPNSGRVTMLGTVAAALQPCCNFQLMHYCTTVSELAVLHHLWKAFQTASLHDGHSGWLQAARQQCRLAKTASMALIQLNGQKETCSGVRALHWMHDHPTPPHPTPTHPSPPHPTPPHPTPPHPTPPHPTPLYRTTPNHPSPPRPHLTTPLYRTTPPQLRVHPTQCRHAEEAD